MTNTRNIGICYPKEADYDLQTLIIIRLGSENYECTANDLFHFLTLLFYPQKPDFSEQIKKYIDFSQNLELLKEVEYMGGLGQSILEEGVERGSGLKLISQTRKKLVKHIPVESCAEMLEDDPVRISQIYALIQAHPDWDDSQIHAELFKNK
jgi:hypothetical protein